MFNPSWPHENWQEIEHARLAAPLDVVHDFSTCGERMKMSALPESLMAWAGGVYARVSRPQPHAMRVRATATLTTDQASKNY